MRTLLAVAAFSLVLACTSAVPAKATTIDFENEAANAGGMLTGIPDSPLMIGIATFTGGELRQGLIGLGSDTTGVYATQGIFGSGETNPVTISFATPIEFFSIMIANGEEARAYTVTDDLGHSATSSLPSAGALGKLKFSLGGFQISSVTISSANANDWNFAVDDVTFQQVPEPASIVLSGLGLGAAALLMRRRSNHRR